jgi:hypothetical protein
MAEEGELSKRIDDLHRRLELRQDLFLQLMTGGFALLTLLVTLFRSLRW